MSAATFKTPHNEAFRALGARAPSQHWSAFDVTGAEARAGRGHTLVTTIWNVHSVQDSEGQWHPSHDAICRDKNDGTFWYSMGPRPARAALPTRVAHWNRLQIAFEKGLPIIGVLKDYRTGACSLDHVFDCGTPRYALDDGALWLRLVPRSDVGWTVREMNMRALFGEEQPVASLDALHVEFERAVASASRMTPQQRAKFLPEGTTAPRRIQAATTVFERNPYVVAEALARAKGVCEGCRTQAPFTRRSDGSPYLEVHHIVPLAQKGLDTVANTVALCPNCHRERHYG